jgi:hypothetical protein
MTTAMTQQTAAPRIVLDLDIIKRGSPDRCLDRKHGP